jgi:pilus assembly protein CpaB
MTFQFSWRLEMRGNTLVMLIIALVFGAVAVFFANIWLNSQSNRPAQVATTASTVETSTIVVAARDLSFGEPLNAEVLREIPWPKSSIPDGAFAKITELTADGRHVVLTSISPNEPVLKWKISGAGARASLSAIVGAGMRAVAIRINEVVGVGGFILPGDHVDVLYTRGGNSDGGSSTDILIQNVRILAIERVADQKKSEPIMGNVATVEVTTLDAQKIALAQTTGSLSLTLRSAGSLDQAPAQRVVEQELVSSPSVYQKAIDAQTAAQAQLDARLKGLEEAVKQTAKATGEGEEALRAKLAALEAEIRKAGSSTAGEEALRAKLAEFEANLRTLASTSNTPVFISPAAEQVNDAKPLTVSVGVTRGIKRQSYEVPFDITNQ